jgi:hypothetical protein
MLLVGWHAYLRTGEMLNITKSKISLGETKRVISLGITKARRHEMVTIDDPVLVRLLKIVLAEVGDQERLCELSESQFRSFYNELMRWFGLVEFGFKPYSIRRGGATADFAEHGSMDRCCVRGRWSSASSARYYITQGMAQLGELSLSSEQRALLEAMSLVKVLGE